MLRRRGGFTLIELLVVIAIIAILAAMLFPVFARARESARKIQCLSNIKNIALAMQMYLGDYDRFPPGEHRQDVANYFEQWGCSVDNVKVYGTNPFLKWPVILDEYIKNRDVWGCPSAKLETGVSSILPTDWFGALVAAGPGVFQSLGIPCRVMTFPPGWGGDITDSLTQNLSIQYQPGGERYHSFVQSIGTGGLLLADTKLSAIEDPVMQVVCADSNSPSYANASCVIFPDVCAAQCGSEADNCCNGGVDNIEGFVPMDEKHSIWDDGTVMDRNARHLGGSNLGFADGHAAWWNSQSILSHVTWHKLHKAGGDGTLKFAVRETGAWGGCLCCYAY